MPVKRELPGFLLPLIVALGFVGSILTANGPLLYHQPPGDARKGQDVGITATLFSTVPVREALLYYRLPGAISYLEIPLKFSQGSWIGVIPGSYLTQSTVEYALIFQLEDGGMVAFPQEDPLREPYRLSLKPALKKPDKFIRKPAPVGTQYALSDVMILSPDPGALINPKEVVIAASIFAAQDIDTTTIRLSLDGKDVTPQTTIGGGIVTYVPDKIEQGPHSIKLEMNTNLGVPVKPVSWSFQVVGIGLDLLKNVEYNGNIQTRLSTEAVGGTVRNVAELTGTLNGGLSWASMRGFLRRTTRESPYLQPYNRLSLKLQLGDYLTLDIGDFNPTVSPFTLSGKRVRGLGVDIDLDWFQVQAIQGELNRAVQQNNRVDGGIRLLTENTSRDTTNRFTFTLDRTGYTFKRDLYFYRLAAVVKTYQFGLHVLKAKDDITSVDQYLKTAQFSVDSTAFAGAEPIIPLGNYTYSEFTTQLEGTGSKVVFPADKWGGNSPEDNLIIGFDFGSQFDKERMEFKFTWNLSLYNRDIWEGAMSRAEMDTALDDSLDGLIGVQYDENGLVTGDSKGIDTSQIFDPLAYEKLFTMNINMSPLVPIDITTFNKHPITTIVNMPSAAFQLQLTGNYRLNKYTIEYRQVGSEFVTLANPYLTNNTREFIVGDRMNLLDNKLFINVSFNHRDNRILKSVIDPLNTNTFSGSVSLIPGPGSPTFVVNFQSIGKSNGKTELELVGGQLTDQREDSRTLNSMISVTYPLEFYHMTHNLVLNFNTVRNQDNLASERRRDYFFQKTDVRTYSITLSSRYTFPLRTMVNLSNSELTVPIMGTGGDPILSKVVWTTLSLRGQYALLENRLKTTGGLNIINNRGITDISLYGLTAGVDYKIQDQMALTLDGDIQLVHDRSKRKLELNTSGLLLTFRYNF